MVISDHHTCHLPFSLLLAISVRVCDPATWGKWLTECGTAVSCQPQVRTHEADIQQSARLYFNDERVEQST